MALLKIKDFDPNYRDTFGGSDIKGTSVYTETTDEKVGTVDDILVDESTSQFRYLVVDLGFWIFGKKVLLPVGRSRMDQNSDRVYLVGLTKEQAENLPEFKEDMLVDYDYEERVRGVYRPTTGTTSTSMDRDVPLEGSATLDRAGAVDPAYTAPMTGMTDPAMTGYADSTMTGSVTDQTMAGDPTLTNPAMTTGYAGQTADMAYDRDTYSYDRDPSLYQVGDANQTLRLYEERLIANKTRMKTGDVSIGKRVETETARASVPIEKERVVIERTTPTGTGTVVSPGEADFQEGEVARMEIYEETPDIRKEAFVREEVQVRKEVDSETVNAEETLRREELDIDSDGRSVEDRTGGTGRLPNDRI